MSSSPNESAGPAARRADLEQGTVGLVSAVPNAVVGESTLDRLINTSHHLLMEDGATGPIAARNSAQGGEQLPRPPAGVNGRCGTPPR